MKKLSCIVALVAVFQMACAQSNGQQIITKNSDGVTVINTKDLASDVKGFRGNTPLEIYVKDGKVQKIVALKNSETKTYFGKVKAKLLDAWNGMTVKAALKAKPDAVTGATLSSNAVKENVRRGLEYYKSHGKANAKKK